MFFETTRSILSFCFKNPSCGNLIWKWNVLDLQYCRGMFSLAVMLILKKSGGFSILGISVAGGVAHNIAQLTAAMLVVSNIHLIYYLPALLIGGAVTGTLIGITAAKIWECLKIAGKTAPINH